MGTIRLVDDNCFKEGIDYHCSPPTIKKWLPIRAIKSHRTIRIAPHCDENWIGVDLFKLKLYCELHKIKVIAYGTINQLPLLSIVADEVMLERADMGGLYEGLSYARNTCYNTNSLKEYVETAKSNSSLIRRAISEITDEEVVERFSDYDICIRKSTFDLFNLLKLPKNVIIAEVKYKNEELLKIKSIVGVDKSFQRNLVNIVDDHYMGIQILACQILNWIYISCNGSGNLFCLIPIKYMTYFDQLVDNHAKNIACSMFNVRYGKIKGYPIVGHSSWRDRNQFDSLDFISLSKAIKKLQAVKTFVEVKEYQPIIKNNALRKRIKI